MTRSDLALIRQAIDHDWPVPQLVRRQISRAIFTRAAEAARVAADDQHEAAWLQAATRTIVAMGNANLRLLGGPVGQTAR